LIRRRRSVTIFAARLRGYFCSVGARSGDGCGRPDRLLARLGEVTPLVRFRVVVERASPDGVPGICPVARRSVGDIVGIPVSVVERDMPVLAAGVGVGVF
jgi:hypothetical protein